MHGDQQHSEPPVDRGRLRQARTVGLLAASLVIAIGLSVRFPITSFSAILPEIGEEYGLSASGLALLSSIPVLLFGLASPLAPGLVRRFGLARALMLLLTVLAVAVILRPLGSVALFIGTALAGAVIALLGILAPQLIRIFLARRGGFWTGVYTTSFGVSAAVGAAAAVPLLHFFDGRVPLAAAAWGVPILIAVMIALWALPHLHAANPPSTAPRTREDSIVRTPGVWAVTGFFGSQALIYFSLTAWLPTVAISRGMAATDAGLLLAWMSLAGLPASLIAPTLASRRQLRIPLIIVVSVLSAIGVTGLAFGPVGLAPIMVAVLGLSLSGSFGLAIALIVFTAPSAAQTAAFSAISQGVGYALAATGPLLLGLFADAGVAWSISIAGLLVAVAGQVTFGVAAARASLRRD